MTEDVNTQESVNPEKKSQPQEGFSDKELNFRKLEAAREAEREARVRAEMQNESLRNELSEIKQMLQPKEKDPLDDVEDYVDRNRLQAKLDKERAHFKKEAKAIAKQTYEEEKIRDEKQNFLQRLHAQFPDYDQVMNETNLGNLEKLDPVFLETVLEVPDDYARRAKTYKKLKSLQTKPKVEEQMSIKEKVEANTSNPFFIPPSTGTPSGVEFDTRSKEARDQAYAKLKAAQRRPIGNGTSNR